MTIRIGNVVFDAPGATLDIYAAAVGSSARMYAELLGMRQCSRAEYYRELGYFENDAGNEVDQLVLIDDPCRPNIAFECETNQYHPPRWPDPEHPQQVHLDITVDDRAVAHQLVLGLGATLLSEAEDRSTYADPIGHPFCLYSGAPGSSTRIARIVFDCAVPEVLAEFYSCLLDMPLRPVDTTDRVEIARSDGELPTLAFQRSDHGPPAWPDPARPQQLHLDLDPGDISLAHELAERLGATRLDYMGGGHVFADPAGHPFCLGE